MMGPMEPTTTQNKNPVSTGERPSLGDRIVRTEGIRGGKPRIAGHRITVADIAIWHERMGMSPDEIVSEYPTITLSDVYAVLAYCHDHRDAIDREIRESEEFVRSFRAGSSLGFRRVEVTEG